MSLALSHFKALCCLGLPQRPALLAIAGAVRDIVPASWTRIGLVDQAGSPTIGFGEHPDFLPLFFKTFDDFMHDRTSLYANFRENLLQDRVGATLPMQNGAYLSSRYYREFERPLDSCWVLEAAIHDHGRPVGALALSRPRSAKPFGRDDVEKLDRLRPWIAHALRGSDEGLDEAGAPDPQYSAATPFRRSMAVFDRDGRILFQTAGTETLFYMLDGTSERGRRGVQQRQETPAAILRLVRRVTGAARDPDAQPPRISIPTHWGLITAEATWLREPGADPADAAKETGGLSIGVHIELREHALAHAARTLRKRGASPVQTRIGALLAQGRSKPEIARQLGIKPSSVVDATRKLYQRIDVRNAAELGNKLWLREPS